MTTEDQTETPQRRGPVRRAVRLGFLWLISPSFFKIKSPNPFKVHGPASEQYLVRPMRQRRERNREAEAIDREIDGFDLDAWTSDRYIFESYVKSYGLNDHDLLVHHYRYTRRGLFRLIATTAAAVAVFVLTHLIAAGSAGHLFALSLFAQSPTWVAMALVPPLIVGYLLAVQDLFRAWCVRQRRHGSFAAFLLWISSPDQWFVSPRLSKLPKVKPLPKAFIEALHEQSE